MKAKVPPHPEHDQRRPEMHRGDAGKADPCRCGFQQQAERHDPWRAETRDQRAREEARPVHRHDVPLNAEIGIADGQPAHLHGERRRGHHEIHHGVGDHPAQRGRDEARLPRDLEQRPAAMHVRRRGLRRIDAREHRHRHQRDDGLHHEAEGKQIRRPDIHGPLHELRTEHAGEYAARHHPGQGLGTERCAGAVGGGEAIGLRHRAIEPAEKGRDSKTARTIHAGSRPRRARRSARRRRCR